MCANGQGLDGSLYHSFQIKCGLLERQSAALDPCEIENSVYQVQQRVAAIDHDLQVSFLVGVERGVSSSNCAIPRIAFIGVRISCDMLDRNSDFACDAASAASRAVTNSVSASLRTVMS
jgi:hypothetical protein